MIVRALLLVLGWGLLHAVLVVCVGVPGAPLFQAEAIRMELDRDEVRVLGRYRYENPGLRPLLAPLYTPLPDPDTAGLELWREGPGGRVALPWLQLGGAAYWGVRLAGRERVEVGLRYRHPRRPEGARYVLGTTGAWRRPIPRARFELVVAPDLLVSAPGLPLTEQPLAHGRSWQGDFQDFWPPADWVVVAREDRITP